MAKPRALVVTFDDPSEIEAVIDDDGDDGLDNPSLEEVTCGLNEKDGTCSLAHTLFCFLDCEHGGKRK